MNSQTVTPSVWASPVIWVVSLAHGYSHLVMLVLPPLFLILSASFEVSVFELGLLISGFNLVTALTQFPISRLIDRYGGPLSLRIGLGLSTATMALAAIAPNFWVFALAYLLCGLANSVYHPADFRILNATAAKESRAMAFSIHLTAGNIGFALAPAMLTPLGIFFGWRVALGAVVLIGLICLLLLCLQKFPQDTNLKKLSKSQDREKLSLARRDIWVHLAIFTFFSVISGGIQSFSVLAGHMAFGLSTESLTAGLSLYLLSSGCGTLVGGLILKRFPGREQLVFLIGSTLAALLWATLWFGAENPLAYVCILLLVGLASGSILPARDMLTAAISTPQTQGQIYGFVTTGINIGQLTAPLIFGAMLSASLPMAYFAGVFAIMLIVPVLALFNRERKAA
jgi:FSR family fosmidomycin resistance protein-like MFS transporter